ncbi:MAG: hypothetical protein OEY33_09945 [Bdellovibrionales bacterium]|nr:hypothetical protein [Bdellovibrionales bacterium]
MRVFILTLIVLTPFKVKAFLGDGGAGWAQVPYLVKILAENIKRYQQLKILIKDMKNRDAYLKLINAGLENSVGLLDSIPIKDEEILSQVKSFKKAIETIEKLYGQVPKSNESAMQLLHDRTIAESMKMIIALKEYSKRQEKNAKKISDQSRSASPKGAARMNTQTSAHILHTLNQLLKINGQILKLQSEQFALANKEGKENIGSFQKINMDLRKSLKSFSGSFNLPRF